MDKRYQVFISSTFQDLQNARQEVSQALLRADCFPAGMEFFPAADEQQFEFIKRVIDQSDYYVLISAGRYGSIHQGTKLSYTEMEYDYAVETGKPVIRLLHKDPLNELPGKHIEATDEGKSKLVAFRKKLMDNNLVSLWETDHALGLLVREGLANAIKTKPAAGWVRHKNEQTQENPSRADEISALAREISYRDLKTRIVPNRMMIGDSFQNKRSFYPDCDLCKGDRFVTIREANSERPLNCPKCEDEGRR